MCLGSAVGEVKKKQIIDSLTKKGYIKVYKVADKFGRRFGSPIWDYTRYKANTIQDSSYVEREKYSSYIGDAGWHGFLDYEGARVYANGNTNKILICYVKPEWIIQIGEICFDYWLPTKVNHLTVRTSKIFFPDFPNRRASIKEFRKALKKEKDNG